MCIICESVKLEFQPAVRMPYFGPYDQVLGPKILGKRALVMATAVSDVILMPDFVHNMNHLIRKP